MIYIDPPYNTGRDFVYPDDYRDGIRNYLEVTGQVSGGNQISSNTESSGRFHTDWLNMIFPRLKVARSLLADDGFLFISVDDGEISNARKLCDDIFGAENFIDTMIWKKRYGGGAKEKYLVSLHEYVLVYAKDLQSIEEIFVPLSEASVDRYYTLQDEYLEERGPFRTHPLEAMKSFEDRPNLSFPIPAPDGTEFWPKRQWRWGKERKGCLRLLSVAKYYFPKIVMVGGLHHQSSTLRTIVVKQGRQKLSRSLREFIRKPGQMRL